MSKFIELPVFDKEQKTDVMAFVNIDQIRCIIPKPKNKCKVVFDDETYYTVSENHEDMREKLERLGYYSDL